MKEGRSDKGLDGSEKGLDRSTVSDSQLWGDRRPERDPFDDPGPALCERGYRGDFRKQIPLSGGIVGPSGLAANTAPVIMFAFSV